MTYLEINERRKRVTTKTKSNFVRNFRVFQEFGFFWIDPLQNIKSHGVFCGTNRVDQQLENLWTKEVDALRMRIILMFKYVELATGITAVKGMNMVM